jgi:hypothetical protein
MNNMKTFKNILILASLSTVFFSCKSPLDKEYEVESAYEDFKRIVHTQKIDSSETVTLAKYMVEKKLLPPQTLELGATYRDILKQAQEFDKLQQAQEKLNNGSSLKAKIDSMKRMDEVRNSISISLDTHYFDKKTQTLRYEIRFWNKLGRNIRAFKGELALLDIFRSKAKAFALSCDKTLKADSSYIYQLSLPVNDLNGRNRVFISDTYLNLKPVWATEDLISE